MSTQYKPITAITMGDPAGIGPEIVVGTMLSEEIHDCCRPFVIGSIAIMERAAKVLGKELKYNKIEDPSEAKYEFGTVDIIETGDYDPAISRLQGINLPEAWNNLGVAYAMKKDYTTAMQYFDQAAQAGMQDAAANRDELAAWLAEQ